jgi:hypothetical protein
MRYMVKMDVYFSIEAEDDTASVAVANKAVAKLREVKDVPGVMSCSLWSDKIHTVGQFPTFAPEKPR